MENVQIIAYRFNGNPDELMHYRTKGSKNGVRLYQYRDGSLTPLGRKHYGVGEARGEGGSDNTEKRRSLGQVMKDRKTAKKRAESLAKAREAKVAKKQAAEEEAKKKAEQESAEAKAREEKEAERQRIIKTGTAEEALKNVGDLSQQEMDYISKRIKWEQDMKKAIADGETEVGQFFKKVDKGIKYAESGAKVWNTAANIVNAFNGEKIMPKIDTNITNGNKKDIIDRRKDKRAEEAGKKPMPSVDDVLKDLSKYSNEELKRMTDRKNTEDNFKKAFTEQPKYKAPSAEDILKDPDKYSDDDVSKAATRKKNLKNLEDSPSNKNGNVNTADMDDIVEARINEILEERLRNM